MELPARATRIVNLKQIVTSGQPDEAGQVIPPGTSLGSATIRVTGGQDSEVLAGGSVTFDPDTGRCGGDMLPICDNPEHPRDLDLCDIIPIIITVCEVLCDPDIPPHIDSISPDRALIGHPVDVVISGNSFGNDPTLSVDSGITASITSSSGSQINARFNISSNDVGGNHSVFVQNSHGLSNAVNFYVQIPDRLRVVSDTGPASNAACPTIAGRSIVYQVIDQSQPGSPITADVSIVETFGGFANNPCNSLTPTPFGCAPTGDAGGVGTFRDNFTMGCAAVSPCQNNSSCGYTFTQTWTTCGANGSIILAVNALEFRCEHIFVNGSEGFSPGAIMPK